MLTVFMFPFQVIVELPQSYIPLKSDAAADKAPHASPAEERFKSAVSKQKVRGCIELDVPGCLSAAKGLRASLEPVLWWRAGVVPTQH